jgi:hypothetical protein
MNSLMTYCSVEDVDSTILPDPSWDTPSVS